MRALHPQEVSGLDRAWQEEQERELRQQENLQRLRGFRPIDDTFMRALMKDNMPLAEFVLRIIMGKPDLRLVKFNTQDDMKQVTGARSVCLDVTATDDEGRKYDIEVQRADSGAEPRRARYHSSVMDVEYLSAGQDFNALPDTYVIFITEKDVYADGAAVHSIQRMDVATGKLFDDGEHILYVNGEYRGEDALGRLMHDFNCNDPDDMNYRVLADRARYFKTNSEGVTVMCKAMDDLRIESERRGEIRGEEKKAKESAKNFYAMGLSVEDIAKGIGYTLETVREWLGLAPA